MNTKIGTSFGLALLIAIAAIATMFALGMFSTNEVSAGHNTANATHVLTMDPSSKSVNAKASWNITLGVSGAALTPGTGTIDIKFPTGVSLPATIDKTRISVGTNNSTTGGTTYKMFPLTSDPTISGQTLTLTVPATNAGGVALDSTEDIDAGHQVQIFISQLAGLVNPAKSDSAGKVVDKTAGQIKTSADTVFGNIPTALSFNRTISLGGKTSQTEGGSVTVTVGGFTPGLTVKLSGGSVTGTAVVGDDRKAVIAGTKTGSDGKVTATDTSGLSRESSDSIAVKASLIVTATGKAGDTITLTGKNFTHGARISITGIKFGGNDLIDGLASASLGNLVDALPKDHENKDAVAGDENDDFLIKITIPSNVSSGVNQIKVTEDNGGTKSATATIVIEGRTVLITPDSGPPGTVVTITGSGFPSSRTSNDANTSDIDLFSPGATKGLFTDGSGNLPGSDQFKIPSDAKTSVIKLTVTIKGTDTKDATGSDKFTVTSRVLIVVPTSGPRGTKVLVTGTKFTNSGTVEAGVITVDGQETTHTLSNLTSSGDVPGISLSIPAKAGIGSKTVSLTDKAGLKGTTKFTITVPTISVTVDSATMGQSVPVTGAGWVPSSSVTVTLSAGGTTVITRVATADGAGDFETSVTIPSTVGVGAQTVTFTAKDSDTFGNTATAQTLSIPKPKVSLSSAEAEVGDVIDVEATGFPPSSGLSVLTIGGADVRSGVSTSDTQGSLSTSFIVPGVTGSNIVTVTIGAETVSTSISVLAAKGTAAAATTAPAEIFADVIANGDNLVRVWRFDNASQSWEFYDPRPAFAGANTLEKSGAGDIVWVNVATEQAFQSTTLFPGWNLISLD